MAVKQNKQSQIIYSPSRPPPLAPAPLPPRNHGTETQVDFKYNNGNEEPHRGFGHIAVACDDVHAACAELEKKGVAFQKKPNEGRMKGLAFAKDPDGEGVGRE